MPGLHDLEALGYDLDALWIECRQMGLAVDLDTDGADLALGVRSTGAEKDLLARVRGTIGKVETIEARADELSRLLRLQLVEAGHMAPLRGPDSPPTPDV